MNEQLWRILPKLGLKFGITHKYLCGSYQFSYNQTNFCKGEREVEGKTERKRSHLRGLVVLEAVQASHEIHPRWVHGSNWRGGGGVEGMVGQQGFYFSQDQTVQLWFCVLHLYPI